MKRLILALLTLCLVTSLLPAIVVGADEPSPDFACDYSAESKDGEYQDYVYYGATDVVLLNAQQAADANIPEGYSGDVLVVKNEAEDASGKGVLLDFSKLNIPTNQIKSITFRVYVGTDGTTNDSYPEVRIYKRVSSSWAMRYVVGNQADQWVNITLDSLGNGFVSSNSFETLSKDGFLDKFELSVRSHTGDPVFYIDSISYTLFSALETEDEFACEYFASAPNDYVKYGSTSVTKLNDAEAYAAGIPQGYSGEVLVVENSSVNIGALLDFSKLKIPYRLVESLTFRVYVGDDGRAEGEEQEVRIVEKGVNGWVMRHSVEGKTEQWLDITLDRTGKKFQSGKSFQNLAEDGLLSRFELSVRSYKDKVVFYIDSVQIRLVEDSDAPIFRYSGGDSLFFCKGEYLTIDLSVYDEEMGTEIEPIYEWSDPAAINEDGTLNEGSYTLTLVASDYHGNTATKEFQVRVQEADTEAPQIALPFLEMYLPTGTVPMLSPTVTDNSGRFLVKSYWSEGALDQRGRLTAGIHLYTVVASDYSGNQTVKKLIVFVSDDVNLGDYVIDEETGIVIGGKVEEDAGGSQTPPSTDDNNQDPIPNPDTTPNPDASDTTSDPTPDTTPNPAPTEERGRTFFVGIAIGCGCGVLFGVLGAWLVMKKRAS